MRNISEFHDDNSSQAIPVHHLEFLAPFETSPPSSIAKSFLAFFSSLRSSIALNAKKKLLKKPTAEDEAKV